MDETYRSKEDQKHTQQLRALLQALPPFAELYFRGIQLTTSVLTRLGYGYDLRIFFEFLTGNVQGFIGKSPQDILVEDLARITAQTIDDFMEYLTLYQRDGQTFTNDARGKERKLCTLRTFLGFFFKRGFIPSNVATLVDLPKVHEKPIVRLEVDEVVKLLDTVENGEALTKTQKRYHKATRVRDLALITLFLGTGMRISELVGLDLTDLDFSINGVRVTRKGGNQAILYFSDEVAGCLQGYLQQREGLQPLPGHEQALFLSMQRKRLGVRAVQELVKKYTKAATPLKSVSPHKLRSTYGTMLYQETGDIYLVADVLGHKDINTTKKHYAAMSDERRRMAAKAVKLRED